MSHNTKRIYRKFNPLWTNDKFSTALVQLKDTTGFTINDVDAEGKTVLHHACDDMVSYMHSLCIFPLFLQGADPSIVDNNGQTALEVVLRSRSSQHRRICDIASDFLHFGLDFRMISPSVVPDFLRDFFQHICGVMDQREAYTQHDRRVGEELIECVQRNDLENVRAILAQRPRAADYCDDYFSTVLRHACEKEVRLEIFEEVLAHCRDVCGMDAEGNTALHVLNLSQFDKTQRLLQCNCPPQLFERRNHLQRNALEHCVVHIEADQLEHRLLQAVAIRYTPSQLSRSLCAVLGAPIFGRKYDKRYSFHALKIARVLIACGADINHPNCNGETLLHLEAAVEENNPKIEQLLELGADWRIEDHAGWTAHSLASPANRHFFDPLVQKDAIHAAIAGVSEEAGEGKRRL